MIRWISILLLVAAPLGAQSMSGVSVGQPADWFAATFDGPAVQWIAGTGGCGNPAGSEDCWYWYITDADASGFAWPVQDGVIGDLKTGEMGCTYTRGESLVSSQTDPHTSCLDVQIIDATGAVGKALYMEFAAQDTRSPDTISRLQYKCKQTDNSPMEIFDTGYIEWVVRFQADLDDQCCQATCNDDTASCWRYMAELWEDNGAGEYARITLNLVRRNATNDQWEWRIAHSEDTTGDFVMVWEELYTAAPVTAGEWMTVGWEWVRDEVNGTSKLWVNDSLILSKTGDTSNGDSFFFLDFLMVYTNSVISCTAQGSCISNPSSQEIQSVRICESRAECG